MKGRDSGMPDEGYWESFFNPACILEKLGCAGDVDVVEFGCGYGTFTIPAARQVSGNVVALDIEPAMIAATAEKAAEEQLTNIDARLQDFVATGTGPTRAPATRCCSTSCI
jgi:2-polyprenyl-3-methyl-5-hydroxy-6-metoxy-1,4-benzoquinol methylase